MSVWLGVDAGGTATKIVVWHKHTQEIRKAKTFPSLADEPPSSWASRLWEWTDALEYPFAKVTGIGMAIAAPVVHGKIHEKTGKFAHLKGESLTEIATMLRQSCDDTRVAMLHDGAAALLRELVAIDAHRMPTSAGILTFGHSVGFGYAWRGEILVHPYTSWVSHVQLQPGFPGSICRGCQQRGCWRAVYQAFREQEDTQPLVEVIAQGTAMILNTFPLDCLFLGGGRLQDEGRELFTGPPVANRQELAVRKSSLMCGVIK